MLPEGGWCKSHPFSLWEKVRMRGAVRNYSAIF